MEGDSIEGTVAAKRSGTSAYGNFDVLALDTLNGQVDVACFGVSLKRLGAEANIGDSVSVTFVGERQAKNGRTYKHYDRTLNGVSL
jgi:hypothetical protein